MRALIAVLALAGATNSAGVLLAAPVGAGDEVNRGFKTLEGTWRMEVTTKNCATGVPILSFRAYLTFARGGTMTGTTSAPIFKPGQRTSDHGVWRRTGGHTYETASEAFILRRFE